MREREKEREREESERERDMRKLSSSSALWNTFLPQSRLSFSPTRTCVLCFVPNSKNKETNFSLKVVRNNRCVLFEETYVIENITETTVELYRRKLYI